MTITAGDLFCVDAETEILTNRGWLTYRQLKVGDLAWSIDPSDNMGRWATVSVVNVLQPEKRRMLSVEGENMSSLTTEDHRWYVRRRYGQLRGRETKYTWEWRTSAQLNSECGVPTAAQFGDPVSVAKYSDWFVELVAWYWTEGYDRPKGGGATIVQSHVANLLNVQKIRRALTAEFGPKANSLIGAEQRPSWAETDDGKNIIFRLNRNAAELLRSVAPNKIVSIDFLIDLTPSQLDLFIERSIDGDGTRSKGTPTLAQKEKLRSDVFQIACILSGRAAHMRTRMQNADYPMHTVAIHKSALTKPFRQAQIEWVERNDIVWCPTTSTGTWLARRNGTIWFTGNCGIGGSSVGLHDMGLDVTFAGNHSDYAIEVHSANFPDTEHIIADFSDKEDPKLATGKPGIYRDPRDLPKVDILWASPSCFAAGTLVLTDQGLIPIEEIVVGSMVWTHRNRWRQVTAAWSTEGKSTVLVKGLGHYGLEATPDHGFHARRKIAENTPRQSDPVFPHACDMCGEPTQSSRRGSGLAKRYCSTLCGGRYRDLRNGRQLTDPQRIEAKDMVDEWWGTPTQIYGCAIPAIPAFVDWYWLGRWVGDGWASGSDVTICCGHEEALDLESKLGEGWVRYEQTTATNFVHYDVKLVEWLTEHFGKGAKHKMIPTWLMAMPIADKIRFMRGWIDADGCVTRDDNWSRVQLSTSSKNLAVGARLIASSLGQVASLFKTVPPSQTMIDGRTVNQAPRYTVQWYADTTRLPKARWEDDGVWSKVSDVAPAQGSTTVYNIEVEEDHTYVADGIFVKNCRHHSPANARKLYERKRTPGLIDELNDGFDHERYAKSEASRVTMVCPLVYAAKHRPAYVIVENVMEASTWGPDRDGTTFKWWLSQWNLIGYEYEIKFLNSRFFPPVPQSRDRMYVVFWRKGHRSPDLEHRPDAFCSDCDKMVTAYQSFKTRKPAWMFDTWGKYRSQYTYKCYECNTDVVPVSWPAYTAIDWTNLGQRIGDRAKPLSSKTMKRIELGLKKFANMPMIALPIDNAASHAALVKGAGNTYERPGQIRSKSVHDSMLSQTSTAEWAIAQMPFITTQRGTSPGHMNNSQSILEQLKTINAGGLHSGIVFPLTHSGEDRATHISDVLRTLTTSREMYVASAAFAKINGGPTDTAWHGFDDPLNTITAKDTHGMMVLPWIEQYRSDPSAITEPLATMTTRAAQALANIDVDPSSVSLDFDVEDVRYRMLDPDYELRRGMGFSPDYILTGTSVKKTAGLGNAVTPPVASWLIEQCVATLDKAA